jgi:hypothetical protein
MSYHIDCDVVARGMGAGGPELDALTPVGVAVDEPGVDMV